MKNRIPNHSSVAFLAWACLLPIAPAQEQADRRSNARVSRLVEQYVPVRLDADLSGLTDRQRKMLPLLLEAAELMDRCFWYEAFGDAAPLLKEHAGPAQKYIEMNYGPWDRLDDNQPFIAGYGEKPAGANFYPSDMTIEEFEASTAPNKDGLYTFLRRGDGGRLETIPYNVQLREYVEPAAELLRQAADLAESSAFRKYLMLRAAALLDDDYRPSDLAWLEMKDNTLDVVIGPIETYEDQLFGYKAAHECYVLLKDHQWSSRLAKYAAYLPELQEGLPVEAKYKTEQPGSDTDLNAYDVLYYAGDCNAGSKTIAINLPNDEQVQLQKGTRRLQLKNAMRAKFDKILLPTASKLLVEDQQRLITFDAFFANIMFHEVAHGLGIKNTITGNGTVRQALKDLSSTIEEGKADILGLYMIQQLHGRDEIDGKLDEYYATFLAGIFRSVRFGAASAHGRANLIRFNFFKRAGAFERTEQGRYRVNSEQFAAATTALARQLLVLQGNGDYADAQRFQAEFGKMDPILEADLSGLRTAGIPVDVVFEQGETVLGL